jgi:hypothetical protein
MKRRNFLGVCLAAIAAPLAALAPQPKQQTPRIFYATEKIKFGEKSKESPVVGDESVGFTCTYNPYIDADEWTAKIKEAMVKVRSIMVTYDKPNMNGDIYMSPEAFEDIKKWCCYNDDFVPAPPHAADIFLFSGLGVSAIKTYDDKLGREEIFELGRLGV